MTCWRCCVDCFDITEKSSRREIGGYLVNITASGTSRVILSPSRRVSVARYIDLDSAVSSADCWEEAEGITGIIGSATCNLLAVTSLFLKLRKFRKLQSLRFLQLHLLPHVGIFSLLVKVNPYLVVVVVRVLVKSVMLGEHVEVSNTCSTAGGSGMCDGISAGDRERFVIIIQLVFIESSSHSQPYQNVIVDVAEGQSSFVTSSVSTM